MVRELARRFHVAARLHVEREARSPERVIADVGGEASGPAAPLDDVERAAPRERLAREPARVPRRVLPERSIRLFGEPPQRDVGVEILGRRVVLLTRPLYDRCRARPRTLDEVEDRAGAGCGSGRAVGTARRKDAVGGVPEAELSS
jgi:hypothetical protein